MESRQQPLLVTEIFHSLQGETSLSGERFAFIRLTGCNLRCTYCDSAYAFKGGTKMSIDEILGKIEPWNVRHVLLTGGEPLLQRPIVDLLDRLNQKNYITSIETHGEHPIDRVAGKARIILDIKTPSSGMQRGGYRTNAPLLGPRDEVKFVIASREDYFWARDLVRSQNWRAGTILFSAAVPAQGAPGSILPVEAKWLAEKILEDQLPVRLQIQLHKLLWGANRTGV
jgi:7-carboxy-7-deazaguanine synthase